MAHLVNTTFFAEEVVASDLLSWLRSIYITEIDKSGLFKQILLLEIMQNREPGIRSYALQALADDDDLSMQWAETTGAELACELAARWAGKVLCFTTLMKVLD